MFLSNLRDPIKQVQQKLKNTQLFIISNKKSRQNKLCPTATNYKKLINTYNCSGKRKILYAFSNTSSITNLKQRSKESLTNENNSKILIRNSSNKSNDSRIKEIQSPINLNTLSKIYIPSEK